MKSTCIRIFSFHILRCFHRIATVSNNVKAMSKKTNSVTLSIFVKAFQEMNKKSRKVLKQI